MEEQFVQDNKTEVKMPFAGYDDFDACVSDQKSKGKSDESAKKICGYLKHKTESEQLQKEVNKMESEIKKDKNPIQKNPDNPRNPKRKMDGQKNVPDDKEAKQLVKEIEAMEDELKGKDDEDEKPLTPLKPTMTGGKEMTFKQYINQKKEFQHQTQPFREKRLKEADDVTIETDKVEISSEAEAEKPKYKEVTVCQAEGGWVVSSWDTNDKIVCNTWDEVLSAMQKVFGSSEE